MAAIACTVTLAGTLSAQTPQRTGAPVVAKRTLPGTPTPVKPLHTDTASTSLKAKKLPDLQVGVIKISPQHPGEGQTVTFEGNIMNYGLGSAQNPVVTLTVTGPAGVSLPLYRKQFNVTLGKNQGVTLVQKFKVPKYGSYTRAFTLDPAGMIAETDDNNNMKKLSFGVDALPDLKSNNKVQGSFFVRLPHHDKYSASPKCSNNRTFNSWEQCDSMN